MGGLRRFVFTLAVPPAYRERVRQIAEYDTEDGRRYRVRFRLGGRETSETFRRKADAEMFRDILGDGKNGRTDSALSWLYSQQQETARAETVTFAEWFVHYVAQLTGVTPRTRGDYESLRRRYLTELDHLPLTLITRGHITGIVNRLEREGRAPKTIKQTINTLSTCFALAVDEGHMKTNPCRRVRLPKDQHGSGTEPRFLTHDQAAQLIAATAEHYRPLVTFLFGTGMRWSEATALQGRHVNLDAGTVRVEQAWKRVPGDGYQIGVPKTVKARRTVNAAVPALVAVAPLLRGPKDYVFTTRSGGPVMHANFYTNIWAKACAASGLDPAPRIHDCRHSHASWLISDGMSLESVQDQLGHESIETTRRVYGGLLPAVGVAVGRSASAAMALVLEASRPLELPQGPDV